MEGVISLAVQATGSAVRVKADALVDALLFFFAVRSRHHHKTRPPRGTCRRSGPREVRFGTLSVTNRQFDCGCCAETGKPLAKGSRSY